MRPKPASDPADYVYRFEDCAEAGRIAVGPECCGEELGRRLAMPLIGFLMARADGRYVVPTSNRVNTVATSNG